MILLSALLYKIPLLLIVIILLVSIFLFYLLGVKIGNDKKRHNPDAKAKGIGPLEGALLGLLSLLLSFTLSMSASRYDSRRTIIVQEANDISTVISLADLYSDSIRTAFRKDLKQYVTARIAYYDATTGITINQELSNASITSARIWERAAALSKKQPEYSRDMLMLPAISTMTDIVTSRDAGRLATVPGLIIYLLIILTILGSFIVGYSKKESKNDWIILTMYALMTGMTIYTILDLDQPRSGLIQTNSPHEKIIELRELFLKK